MVRRDLRVLIQQEKEKLLSYAQVRVIDEPYLPVTKKTPNLKLNLVIAAVLAFMLAIFIIFFTEFII